MADITKDPLFKVVFDLATDEKVNKARSDWENSLELYGDNDQTKALFATYCIEMYRALVELFTKYYPDLSQN